MDKVGFITTIPVEILLAAGKLPVDINNVFVSADSPGEMINQAEDVGFPRNYCSWIKGTYAAIMASGIKTLIVVGEGECSGSFKQSEILTSKGVSCVSFSYPQSQQDNEMQLEIQKLMDYFNVTDADISRVLPSVHRVRAKLKKLDTLTYNELNISSAESHIWLISSTDFNGDIHSFENQLDGFLSQVESRKSLYHDHIKLGLIGIPPIVSNLFDIVESLNAVIVFNEMPRQFSMPHFAEGLVEQYRQFTYPYDISCRVKDIKDNIKLRRLDGIIHYTQSFCPRQLDDITLKNELSIPFLTVECDRPGVLDERNIIRIEAFLERWK